MLKKQHSAPLLGLCGLLILILSGASYQPTGELTKAEVAGKKIFLEGIGEGPNKIMAQLSGTAVPASVLPCANCHGKDGKGKTRRGHCTK